MISVGWCFWLVMLGEGKAPLPTPFPGAVPLDPYGVQLVCDRLHQIENFLCFPCTPGGPAQGARALAGESLAAAEGAKAQGKLKMFSISAPPPVAVTGFDTAAGVSCVTLSPLLMKALGFPTIPTWPTMPPQVCNLALGMGTLVNEAHAILEGAAALAVCRNSGVWDDYPNSSSRATMDRALIDLWVACDEMQSFIAEGGALVAGKLSGTPPFDDPGRRRDAAAVLERGANSEFRKAIRTGQEAESLDSSVPATGPERVAFNEARAELTKRLAALSTKHDIVLEAANAAK